MKLKVGVFSFTCCEGCVVSFIETLNTKYFEWAEKMQIENFRALKKYKEIDTLDLALVEGAISTKHDLKKLKEIRKKTKFLVALGSGASNGYPSNQRNNFSEEIKKEIAPEVKRLKQLPKISPLKDFVKVDDEINGCPVREDELIKKIDGYLKNA